MILFESSTYSHLDEKFFSLLNILIYLFRLDNQEEFSGKQKVVRKQSLREASDIKSPVTHRRLDRI